MGQETSPELLRGYIRPAVAAIPKSMVQSIGKCAVSVSPLEPGIGSRWSLRAPYNQIELSSSLGDPHELAMELLLCTGEMLWETTEPENIEGYLELLRSEIAQGIPGEIDTEAFDKKQQLLGARWRARSRRALLDYARSSFSATAAEYIHCLWHDVTVRAGPEYLPAQALRRRLEWMAARYPPNPGYRLFPEEQ